MQIGSVPYPAAVYVLSNKRELLDFLKNDFFFDKNESSDEESYRKSCLSELGVVYTLCTIHFSADSGDLVLKGHL